MSLNKKWRVYLEELSNIIFFWFFAILFFLFFRLIFIFSFIDLESYGDLLINLQQVLVTGFRFDTMVVSYFVIVPFILNLIQYKVNNKILVKRIRHVFQKLFIIFSTLICIVTLNYFKEYNNQFNHFIFLGLYDDLKAVTQTILQEFNPILNLSSFLIIYYISNNILKYTENKKTIYNILVKIQRPLNKTLFIIITLVLFTFSIRGSLDNRPILRHWAYVTNNDFLNKTIINPYKSLLYAIKDWEKLNINIGKNPFGEVEKVWKKSTVCENIVKISSGAKIKKPKQIFLIIMESYDIWPLQKKYKSFKLARNLKSISNKGVYFNRFLPSSESTLHSLNSIITGIPYSGVRHNIYQKNYCSSMLHQIKKLGYSTNFFYGGLLSWGNIKTSMSNYGIDKQFSAADAGGKSESGVWGIEDEFLFRLVTEKVDSTNYSLNIILTTSYHPPYSVDVINRGFDKDYIKNINKEGLKHYDGSMSFDEFSHIWYSDKCIGDFVNVAESKFPNSIFLFTGDHYGRRFINKNPNTLETSCVPFIIYGKSISDSVSTTPGSHIDILPTLIELIAPKGFKYFSFGETLFKQRKSGVGSKRTITKEKIETYFNAQSITSFDINSLEKTKIKSSATYNEYNILNALAWHYIVKGDSIKISKKSN